MPEVSSRREFPLYTFDGALIAWISQARINRLEKLGLARVLRHKKGTINRVVMHQRAGEPRPTALRDYLGTRYSFREHLEDGHVAWELRRLGKGDELRPIFLRVVTECLRAA